MALRLVCSFLFFLITAIFQATALQNQSTFLSLMKQSLLGPAIFRWDLSSSHYCNLPGVTCDEEGYIIGIDISSWSLMGSFPSFVCSYLPRLRVLKMGHNEFRSAFPAHVLNCSFMEEINITHGSLTGPIPDLSLLKFLIVLDLSNNLFTGPFPIMIVHLPELELINFNENPGFDVWRMPESFTSLSKLKVMILSTTSMRGEIPEWIGNMTSLTDLELSGNLLTSRLPATIGKLRNLRLLMLYYNQLSGEIPNDLGNLTLLEDIDLSVNQMTGKIPERLCMLPGVIGLQLYSNKLTGEIPRILGNSSNLRFLSLYRNFLSGHVPSNIGQSSDLVLLELAENRFNGGLPGEACKGGKLLYYLVLDNLFTGELPDYSGCLSLLRFRVSNNYLSGPISEGTFGLPHVTIIDLSFNSFKGEIPKTIGNARNLSNLFVGNNKFSGNLPPEISLARSLVKIDMRNNLFSGPIPSEIGTLSKLNELSLQGNKLSSSIPDSLSSLKSINVLNLSNNLLTGEIPESLCDLLPNSLDFSNNLLSGPVPLALIREGMIESVSGNPGLCAPIHSNLTYLLLPLCSHSKYRIRLNSVWWVVGVPFLIAIVGLLLLVKPWICRKRLVMEQDYGSSFSSSSSDVTSFYKLSFNQQEIIEALIDKNIIGHGGSGSVYKVELRSGVRMAVKKIQSSKRRRRHLDKEQRTEVETLGSIRHKNIVKLYCCFSCLDSDFLVYEYMPNGSLWDVLHDGWWFLDWPSRHKIALGVARGLAYLHHDLLFQVLHRDIKTSNILLDEDLEPKISDFGIAKALRAREANSSTAVIAGTYGYLAPEYAYSTKATSKCDVYSFGVVLLELVTGKKPHEPEFGDNRDIIHWTSTKMANTGVAADALDRRLCGSPFKEEMLQVLHLAVRCTCRAPNLRPSMYEVVQILIEAAPCKSDKALLSFELKDSFTAPNA